MLYIHTITAALRNLSVPSEDRAAYRAVTGDGGAGVQEAVSHLQQTQRPDTHRAVIKLLWEGEHWRKAIDILSGVSAQGTIADIAQIVKSSPIVEVRDNAFEALARNPNAVAAELAVGFTRTDKSAHFSSMIMQVGSDTAKEAMALPYYRGEIPRAAFELETAYLDGMKDRTLSVRKYEVCEAMLLEGPLRNGPSGPKVHDYLKSTVSTDVEADWLELTRKALTSFGDSERPLDGEILRTLVRAANSAELYSDLAVATHVDDTGWRIDALLEMDDGDFKAQLWSNIVQRLENIDSHLDSPVLARIAGFQTAYSLELLVRSSLVWSNGGINKLETPQELLLWRCLEILGHRDILYEIVYDIIPALGAEGENQRSQGKWCNNLLLGFCCEAEFRDLRNAPGGFALPTEMRPSPVAFDDAGFKLGCFVPGTRKHITCTLPEGWTRLELESGEDSILLNDGEVCGRIYCLGAPLYRMPIAEIWSADDGPSEEAAAWIDAMLKSKPDSEDDPLMLEPSPELHPSRDKDRERELAREAQRKREEQERREQIRKLELELEQQQRPRRNIDFEIEL